MILFDKLIECYNNMTPFQAAIGLSLLFLYILYLLLKDYGFPPGPTGIPVFGYWPFLKSETCHIQLHELTKKYGDVFSFRVTGRLYVHLGSIKAIKEAHVTKSEFFAGRFSDYSVLSFLFKEGVAMLNGEPWKVMRKFYLQKFKEYGMNAAKENAAGSIYDTLKETVEELHNTKGQPVQITDLITIKCLLIIRRILFNDQGISKEELQELNDQYSIIMGGFKSTTFLLMGTFSKFCIFPLMRESWQMKRSQKRIDNILADVVRRHKADYEENQVSDIIDYYLKERDDRRKRGDPTADYFTDISLASSLSQFLTDGILTVGLFVGTFLMSLAEHPEEQEKIYEEILDVVGHDRLPTIEDKTKLPYTNAFIYEVMRMSDLFPLFPSLQCSKETTVQGYKFPEGAITLLNVYAAHRDPKVYDDPETFNPSRFLPSPDKQRPELPVMFGVGKRSCIGEGFSMIQAFLFLTTIVKTFRLTFPQNTQLSSITLWTPDKLKICAIPR